MKRPSYEVRPVMARTKQTARKSVGIEPKTRSTPPPYPRTRVAGYLILAKNATPDLQRTFPRTDHNSLLFCEFDRGLYARSCPLCEIPLVGNYRCDNCSGGRVARMWA